MRELQADIQQNFLTAVQHALTSSTTIAAKAFLAWHTSRLPECQWLVSQEMAATPVPDIKRFVNVIFWQISGIQRRASNHLRNQIIATVEALEHRSQQDYDMVFFTALCALLSSNVTVRLTRRSAQNDLPNIELRPVKDMWKE